jgi:hypothetical protein
MMAKHMMEMQPKMMEHMTAHMHAGMAKGMASSMSECPMMKAGEKTPAQEHRH